MRDHISVCICTYHRNAMLAKLLRHLAFQETRGLLTFSVVVVDNDSSAPARADVDRIRLETGLEITYEVEPIRTIPAARNHALQLIKGNFIGIIDDDEFPPPNWLITLYDAVRTFDVDGALGPVYPFFEERPPDWLVKGGIYEWPRLRTGTLLHWQQTRTSNVLIKRDVIDRHGIRFDESFKTGGSDKAFFKQAIDLGFRFVAAEEAPVYEVFPPERWTKRYFIRRALVNGYNARKYLAKEGNGRKSSIAFLRSAIVLPVFILGSPICALVGSQVLVKWMEGGFYHLSMLAAFLGIELRKKRGF